MTARDASAPPPGPGAAGWLSDHSPDSTAARCEDDESSWAHVPHVRVGASALYVGYIQASANNQDAVVARFDAGEPVYCVRHETEGPDSRGVALTWDGGDEAYVVYTVDGGGTALEGHGGWLGSYAPGAISGGGPKVSFVGRVRVSTGELTSGSFVVSVTSDGRVNTHRPRLDDPATSPVRVLADGSVDFLGDSAHKPIDASGTAAMSCTDYPFLTRYRFAADLGSLVCADSTQCVSSRPCSP